MTNGQAVQRYEPRWNGRVAPTVAWSCALAAVVILAIGLAVQGPWWMLSTPVAVIGAIAGGNFRRFIPMFLCLAVIAVLVLVMAVFAP